MAGTRIYAHQWRRIERSRHGPTPSTSAWRFDVGRDPWPVHLVHRLDGLLRGLTERAVVAKPQPLARNDVVQRSSNRIPRVTLKARLEHSAIAGQSDSVDRHKLCTQSQMTSLRKVNPYRLGPVPVLKLRSKVSIDDLDGIPKIRRPRAVKQLGVFLEEKPRCQVWQSFGHKQTGPLHMRNRQPHVQFNTTDKTFEHSIVEIRKLKEI